MKYKSGYKYQLAEREVYAARYIRPPEDIVTDYVSLNRSGILTLSNGYAWDGATCCPDFKWIMRGSAIHDALYQLLRKGLLPSALRDAADRELARCCISSGAHGWQAEPVYHAVKRFAENAAKVGTDRPILIAP